MHRLKEEGIFARVGNFAMMFSVLIDPNGNLAMQRIWLNIGCRVKSDHVGSAISKSGMVENMGADVGITSPSLSV